MDKDIFSLSYPFIFLLFSFLYYKRAIQKTKRFTNLEKSKEVNDQELLADLKSYFDKVEKRNKKLNLIISAGYLLGSVAWVIFYLSRDHY